MKQSITNLSPLRNAVALFLFGLALLPLLILSFYNHPSAVDDFCFADTALKYGIWQGQKFYYDGWTGRYFSNLVVHASPLVWGWYDAYRFIPALLVIAWIASLYSLVSELLPTLFIGTRLIAVGLIFFLYVLVLPSPVESFFWLAAVASYTIPTIFSFYLLTVIIRWYSIRHQPLKTLTTIWACFLVFAIVGSSETNLVWVLLVLGGLLGYQLVFLRRLDWFLVGLLVMALFSTWLLFRAPGNAIRMGGNPHSGDFLFSTGAAFGYLAGAIVEWVIKTPVLLLGILWIPIVRRLARSDHPARRFFMIHPLLAVLFWLGLLGGLIFPSYYGIGIAPAPRVMNVTYTFFLLGWFYVITVWVVHTERRIWFDRRLKMAQSVWITGIAALWIAANVYKSNSLRQIYGDWLSGRAAAYNRDMTDRQRILNDPAIEVAHLPVLSATPPTLFNNDIDPADPQHLWNRCEAGYYGKKVVILDSLTAKKP
ncbi:DUF6056 family protein [Larkinella terrae]|uniref:Glycosyltransferase RgtA/B/C/D-like domain-containing protein n=1 Tax=Larkinella terrae TaxID=2025311 RepID=A0A7K0EFD2_9BACT|nr:DUF6056 family protein [Larkinella terrae]MRS60166.1 hypothetical protein [Larkinella terrae]